MKSSRRLPILLVILAVLAGLVVFGDPGRGGTYSQVVEARPARTTDETALAADNRTAANVAESSSLLALRDRRSMTPSTVAGFEPRDWTPPPPPPPPPSPPGPPPPPQAPSLPFSYLGKQIERGRWTVFLANQERTYVATEGVTIESTYRVEKIAPPTLTVTYLPLQQPQTLAIGSAE